MHVVIIGNGVAGMEAALTIRERQPDWDISIVSEESDHFFSRTALMWVFCGQMSMKDIEPLERDVYERLRFHRVRARATRVDPEAKKVELAGSIPPLSYDRLLIACGSRARPGPWEGSDLRGVGHFVTLQDLAWYEGEVHGGPSRRGAPPRPKAHLEFSTSDSPYGFRDVAAEKRGRLAKQPAVIGGGLIGIEAVEIALAANLRPHFFVREDWFWPIALEPRESRWISDRMADHGVQTHLDHEVEALEGDHDANVTRVRTDRGTYETDCVLIAIGVVPATRWLVGSGIELDERSGGVIVDESLRTNAPDVFAAGDCAAVRWFDGSRRPEQLWYTARHQGRIAGRRVLGDEAEYRRGIWYNSAKLIDVEYTTVGLVNWNVAREQNWFFEETGRVRSTTRIVIQDDRVIGFNMLGRRWDHSVLIRWIEQRRSLGWVLDRLSEARFDTEMVPPLRIPKGIEPGGPAPNPAIAGPTEVPF